MSTNTKTPAMLLQEFTVRTKIAPPGYDLIVCNNGTHENEFQYKVTVGNIEAIGVGRSKQVARHDAAFKAIKLLTDGGIYDVKNEPLKNFNPQLHRNEPDHPSQSVTNSIGTLQDLCIEKKLPPPRFFLISDVGPPHCKLFTYECQLASVKTQATANTKKQAKQLTAKYMLEKIKDIIPELATELENDGYAIMSTNDDEVLSKYREFDVFNVIPDKTARVVDFNYCFLKIMEERNLDFTVFTQMLKIRNEESLKEIFAKLDLKHQILIFQEEPVATVLLNVNTDTPFCVFGMGSTLDIAKAMAIDDTFDILSLYMSAIRLEI